MLGRLIPLGLSQRADRDEDLIIRYMKVGVSLRRRASWQLYAVGKQQGRATWR